MIKIKLTDLEKKLDYKIKKNFMSIGFDTASTTGVGFVSTTRTYASIDWALIKFDTDNKQELYKRMYEEFKKCLHPDTDCCVIEDVFLGMNPDTTIKLARFGGLVLANAIDKHVHFETIGAKSARAKLFKLDYKKYKGKSKQAVYDYLKSLGIELDEDNTADGVLLAILGICDGMDFRSKKDIAKEKKKKK